MIFNEMIDNFEELNNRIISHYDKKFINGKSIEREIFKGIYTIYHDLDMKMDEIIIDDGYDIIKMHYCLSGRCEYQHCKNKINYIGPGDFVAGYLLSNDRIHKFPFKSYKGFSIFASKKVLDNFLDYYFPNGKINADMLVEKLKSNEYFIISRNDPKIQSILYDLMNPDIDFYNERAIVKFLELIIYILSDDMILGEDKDKYFNKNLIYKVKQIKAEVTSDLERYFKIEEISKEYDISTKAFTECFKLVYGKTYYAFIKEYRINQAVEIIKNSNLRMNEVALSVGYLNASKFSKAFVDIIGMTPLKYKKSYYDGLK
jgi:AraC-like DNA-binding protein